MAAKFNWEDPFLLDSQLSDDERTLAELGYKQELELFRYLLERGVSSEQEVVLLAQMVEDARRIEDTWQYLYKGAYWRRGPVTMSAIAAVSAGPSPVTSPQVPERIELAKADWKAGRFALPPGDDREWIPLP